MGQIKQLSSYMADLIAAGEVVERPMSVVKELLENSIDSGADDITIEIENGGITFIRITDNGKGMSKDDASIAFLRHATSKIYEENDLLAIKTLGFRGEALAAISSVSKINLFTKREQDEIATFVDIKASEILDISEIGAKNGTTIIVRDLFFNTPARMKFLKKDYTEASYITVVIENLAIANPNIAFKYIKDSKVILKTTGKGDLKSAIYSVLGKEDTSGLTEVLESEIDGISVSGFISKPQFSKGTRSKQHFFVNGRLVKSRLIMAALEESYKNSIMGGKFPFGVLNIKISERRVDVNVHPTKTEIKFDNEKSLFNAVYVACKNAIDAQNIIVDVKVKPVIPPEKPKFVQEEISINISENKSTYSISKDTTENALNSDCFADSSRAVVHTFTPPAYEKITINTAHKQTEESYIDTAVIQNEQIEKIEKEVKFEQKEALNEKNEEVLVPMSQNVRLIGECFNTFIICEHDGQVIMIDKHAAHERINFNKLLKQKGEIPSQVLLTPKIVELPKEQYHEFVENIEMVNNLGFMVEDFSDYTIIVREIPSVLKIDEINNVMIDICSKIASNKKIEIEEIDEILHMIACKSAIKGNSKTSMYELEMLAKTVIFDKDINFCPHGRPVKVALSKYEIEKMFKRIL